MGERAATASFCLHCGSRLARGEEPLSTSGARVLAFLQRLRLDDALAVRPGISPAHVEEARRHTLVGEGAILGRLQLDHGMLGLRDGFLVFGESALYWWEQGSVGPDYPRGRIKRYEALKECRIEMASFIRLNRIELGPDEHFVSMIVPPRVVLSLLQGLQAVLRSEPASA